MTRRTGPTPDAATDPQGKTPVDPSRGDDTPNDERWVIFRAAPSLDDPGTAVERNRPATDVAGQRSAEEATFRLIVDSIPGFVSTMSAAGEVEFVNQRILDYMGTTLEELRDWGVTLHEDDRARVIHQWSRSVETGQPYDVEHRIRRADGVYRWFHVRGLALRDTEGRIVRWYVLLADIDDRKRAEETLEESERTLRLLIESIPGMIAVSGADGDLEYVNQRLLDFVGTELADLTNLGWTRVLHPEDAGAVVDDWRHSLETGQPLDVTFRIRRADGVYRWFHSRMEPLLSDQGRIVRWYALFWDVDERKQAEAALQASERALRLLVDTLPGMVSVASAEGTHEYSNRRVSDFLGKELRNVGYRYDIHPDDLAAVGNEWRRCTKAGEAMDLTYRLRRFDGVYRWVNCRVEPLLDEQGNIVRWYALLVDVDDQKKAEEALRTSQAALAHVTRVVTMGELTASIAHEVNQPLAAVVNNANACLGLLPDDVPHLEEVRNALGDIVGDADRASAVLARVRQLAKRAPFESTRLDLREVVADVLALARHESATRRVTIRTELPDELPPVLGDRVQLQQVLLNLVVNGLDAMSAVEESERMLTIGGRCETRAGMPEVVLSVQDAGIGFAAAGMGRLFEAFYTTKPQGMGMGLAISRSIIAAHGGRLWAEPNRGPGATFVLSLPAADSAAS
jgi:PAS domain S-box-containing protein